MPSSDESKTRLCAIHVSPLQLRKRENAVAFVSHVTRRALGRQRGVHRPCHGKRPVIVLSGEGAVRCRRKDSAGPVKRTQRVIGQWHDDVWWPRLLLIRRVKRYVHGNISRPHELKPIEQQLMVHPENGRALAVAAKLKILIGDPHEPEQTR